MYLETECGGVCRELVGYDDESRRLEGESRRINSKYLLRVTWYCRENENPKVSDESCVDIRVNDSEYRLRVRTRHLPRQAENGA